MFGNTIIERNKQNHQKAILLGLQLDGLCSTIRNRLLKAATNLRWDHSRFFERNQVVLFAKAARQVRDNLMAEGSGLDIQELDMVYQRLNGWVSV